jgi:hypothetical protein
LIQFYTFTRDKFIGMIKNLFFLLALLTLHPHVDAQEGNVTINKDARIDAIVAKKSEINGYRIQLFFDSDKSQVNNARSRFISQYPKVDTYVEFKAPNFFLKVGDFRTRLEAEKVLTNVKAEFPTSFIIQEKINPPRLKKELD